MDRASQVNKIITQAFASSQRGGRGQQPRLLDFIQAEGHAGESRRALAFLTEPTASAWESNGDGCPPWGGGGASLWSCRKKNNLHEENDVVWYFLKDVILFLAYKEMVSRQVVVLKHKERERLLKLVKPQWKSRYFPEGRAHMKRRIRRKLGKWGQMRGVLVTLTYDVKRISKRKAWGDFSKHVSDFIKAINEYRKRKGWKKRLAYLWVVEVQEGTGYPHLHIFFPNLRWLAPKEYLQRLWGKGRTRVEGTRTIHGASYICKYITKFGSWTDLHQALIWLFKKRLYGTSQHFYLSEVKIREWQVWFCIQVISFDVLVVNLRQGGFSVSWIPP